MKFSKSELAIIATLSLLTALEALSIDLYLPAFDTIAHDLHTAVGNVQISLSVFIGGFALGQLLWGSLSDKYGRKKPLIAGIILFIISSFAISLVHSIEMLWIWRFIQAFSGSAGVVISRAIVTDLFPKEKTIGVFTILNMLMGVVPIIAPILGNLILKIGHWHNLFIVIAVIGLLSLGLVFLFIPNQAHSSDSLLPAEKPASERLSFIHFFQNKSFLVYTLIGSLSYSSLMIYISNSPFLFITTAKFTGFQYGLLFATNSIGLIGSSYLVNLLIKRFKLTSILKYVALLQAIAASIIMLFTLTSFTLIPILILLFFYLMGVGIFLPSTIELALAEFRKNSGTASSIFGFVQLTIAFLLSSLVSILQQNSVIPMIIGLFICAFSSVILAFVNTPNKRSSIRPSNYPPD